jgi:hypothetical protein
VGQPSCIRAAQQRNGKCIVRHHITACQISWLPMVPSSSRWCVACMHDAATEPGQICNGPMCMRCQVHLKAATLRLQPMREAAVQQQQQPQQPHVLCFQQLAVRTAGPGQEVRERVCLEARLAVEEAQLPAPVQARRLEVPPGQLEAPSSLLLNVRRPNYLSNCSTSGSDPFNVPFYLAHAAGRASHGLGRRRPEGSWDCGWCLYGCKTKEWGVVHAGRAAGVQRRHRRRRAGSCRAAARHSLLQVPHPGLPVLRSGGDAALLLPLLPAALPQLPRERCSHCRPPFPLHPLSETPMSLQPPPPSP